MGGGHGYGALGGATVNSVGEEGGCSKVCVALTTDEEKGGSGGWRRRTIIAAAASSAANVSRCRPAVVLRLGFLRGANSSLTATVVVVTGLVGANFVQAMPDKLRFRDPIVRGIATASSAHGLGTTAFSAKEPEALPFCAIGYTLNGSHLVEISIKLLQLILSRMSLDTVQNDYLSELPVIISCNYGKQYFEFGRDNKEGGKSF